MNDYEITLEVNPEISFDLEIDKTYSPKFITQTIVTGGGGTTMATNNMRWDSVVITSDPQTIVFREGVGMPTKPFTKSPVKWVIAFPLCTDSTGAEVTPLITNRTVNGFDLSIGDTSGIIEYIAME
jgi:hypothetical protein